MKERTFEAIVCFGSILFLVIAMILGCIMNDYGKIDPIQCDLYESSIDISSITLE